VGKTVTPLTTIKLTCPSCKKTMPVDFSHEVTSLPLLKLEVAEGVIGKCCNCGHVFKHVNKDRVFKYMDTKKLAYRRPTVARNLITLIVPVFLVIILASVVAAFVYPGIGSPLAGDGTANGSPTASVSITNGSNVSAANNTTVSPMPKPALPSPLKMNKTAHYDLARGKYYLPVTLAAGSSPVDLQKLTVSVGLNNRTITPSAWEYGEDSCLWGTHNTAGSGLGRNDTATIVVDMSYYNFDNTTPVSLDFTVPGYAPLAVYFKINRNVTATPVPPIIYDGVYDFVYGESADYNATNIVTVSGRVIVNKWPASNIAVSFYDNYTTNSVTSIENGYYTINLAKNQTYRLQVSSDAYGTLLLDKQPRIFMNDTTLDIRVNTTSSADIKK
jgi:hypothetical protein